MALVEEENSKTVQKTKKEGGRMNDKKLITNPVKAIRAFCLGCVGGNANEVKLCPAEDCELYPFRFGKNPYRTKRELTEEQKAVMVERLAKAKESKLAKNAQ